MMWQVTQMLVPGHLGEREIAAFDPATLLVVHPVHPTRPQPADPAAYGQRLWAALGGDALQAALAPLPLAPSPDSCIAIRTGDADLAAIPWEYLHS
jgi:hypothetical protein